jgi:hypothetical protein
MFTFSDRRWKTKEHVFTKVAYFLKIYYHTTFQHPILGGTNFAPTSQIYVAAQLVLLMEGNEDMKRQVSFQWHDNTKFHENLLTGLKVTTGERETHTRTHAHARAHTRGIITAQYNIQQVAKKRQNF